MCCKQPCLVVT